MSQVLLGLGPFRFYASAPSYNKLVQRRSFRWTAQERVARPLALQWIGTGEQIVSLEGVLYPHRFGGFEQLQALKASAAEGQIHHPASSSGSVFGPWVIMATDDGEEFYRDGLPQRVEFTIDLQAYGPDAAGFGGGLF